MINVLSLFNGISGCHLALERADIAVGQVYYAEIDKYANKVTEKNYPDDVALGDVTKWREWDIDWSEIGLVGAGFPCQAWSTAGKQLGDKDERGMLFWTTLEIIAHVLKHNPSAKFLMENVKMKKDFEQYITHHTEQALGHVEKTLINSALVSAQNRQRYYWTNFEVTQPDDKGVLLRDVLEDGISGQGGAIRGRYNADGSTSQKLELNGTEKTNSLTTVQKDDVVVYSTADNPRIKGITEDERGFRPHKGDRAKSGISECGRILKETADKTDTITSAHAPKVLVNEPLYSEATAENKNNEAAFIEFSSMNETVMKTGKTYCLTANYGGAWAKHSATKKVRTMAAVGFTQDSDVMTSHNQIKYRKLTPIECERLQTFPDGWTDCVSNTQRYKALGNAWTVDVIAHIFKCMA